MIHIYPKSNIQIYENFTLNCDFLGMQKICNPSYGPSCMKNAGGQEVAHLNFTRIVEKNVIYTGLFKLLSIDTDWGSH